MLSRHAHRIAGHSRRYLIGSLVFFVVAVVFGTPVSGLLSSGNADDFVDPGAESRRTSARLEQAVDRTLSPAILVLVRTDGPVLGRSGLEPGRDLVELPCFWTGNVAAAEDGSTPAKQIPSD